MRPRLHLTGRPKITIGEQTLSVPAKGFAMLAVLAGSADGVKSRAELRSMLWAQDDDAQTSANLRQLIARVRVIEPALGAPLVMADRETVRINLDGIDIDYVVLRAFAHRTDYDDLVNYVDTYSGDLLADIAVDTDPFDSWLYVERAWLEDWFCHAAAKLLDQESRPLEPGNAISLAKRLIAVDSTNEAAYRAAMRAYAAMDSADRAKRMYEECVAAVKADADAEPTDETMMLARELGIIATAPPPEPTPTFPAQPVPRSAQSLLESDRHGVSQPRVAFFAPHDITGHAETESLAGLLIEDIAIGLSLFRSFTVVAPHSSMQVHSVSRESPTRAAIGADFAVQSFIKPAHGDPKLALRLTEADGGDIAWAGEFALSVHNLTYCFTEISSRVVAVLVQEIEAVMLKRLRRMEDPGAYRLYLEGRHQTREMALPAMRRARRQFADSLRMQKDYAPALAGISDTLMYEWLLRGTGDTELLLDARHNAELAMKADPQNASAYVSFGTTALYQRQFDESLEKFRIAEQLRPNDAELLVNYADALAHSGEPESAWKIINRAIQLNPLCPDGYWWRAAGIAYQLKQYMTCVDNISRMSNLEGASRLMAAAYAQMGLKEEAKKAADEVRESYPDFDVEAWIANVPNRNKEDSEHYASGLKLAGL